MPRWARGDVVYEPTDVHHCVVSIRYTDNGAGTLSFDHPAYFADPGTIVACDCGRTFVAQEYLIGECFPRWRREGWFARWRRERRQASGVAAPEGDDT